MNNSVKASMFFLLGSILWLVLYMSILKPNNTSVVEQVKTNEISQTDSLQKVVDSLQVELQSQAQKFDNKEKEYNKVIFEYELGIDRIKNYHPNAYEDFHRILAYKEEYSREDEMENKKRLKSIHNANYK